MSQKGLGWIIDVEGNNLRTIDERSGRWYGKDIRWIGPKDSRYCQDVFLRVGFQSDQKTGLLKSQQRSRMFIATNVFI